MNVNPDPPPESVNVKWAEAPAVSSKQATADFTRAFTRAMVQEDIEGVLGLIAAEGEWIIMATGETFRGTDEIREMAIRSVAARDHQDGTGIEPTNVFTDAEGTKICWEYVRTGVVAELWPASPHKPAAGTKYELPVMLMGEIVQGKLVKIREYFDLLTIVEAGTQHQLYS